MLDRRLELESLNTFIYVLCCLRSTLDIIKVLKKYQTTEFEQPEKGPSSHCGTVPGSLCLNCLGFASPLFQWPNHGRVCLSDGPRYASEETGEISNPHAHTEQVIRTHTHALNKCAIRTRNGNGPHTAEGKDFLRTQE